MKGIFKLVKGEFTKLLKSNTLYIMAAMLVAVIALMSLLYATQEQNLNTLIEFMVGGGPELDSFDIMDGGESLDALKNAGLSTGDLESFSAQLAGQPQVKMLLIGVNPAVLKAASTMSLGDGGTADLSGFSELDRAQTLLYNTYFYDLYRQAIFYDDLLQDQRDRISQAGFNISYNDIIKQVLGELHTSYTALMGDGKALDAYNNVDKSDIAATQAAWNNLRAAIADFSAKLTIYNFYIDANAMSTNYLLMPTVNMSSEEYRVLSNGVKALDIATLNSFDKYVSGVHDYYAVSNFVAATPTAPADYTYPVPKDTKTNPTPPSGIPPMDYIAEQSDRLQLTAYQVVEDLTRVKTRAQSADSLFYAYDTDMVNQVTAYLTTGNGGSQAITAFIDRFDAKLGAGGQLELDAVKPFESAIDAGYTAVITKDIYDESIAPYYDDSEMGKLSALRAELDTLLNQMTDKEIFMLAAQTEISPDDAAALNTLYTGIKSAFKEYTSRTGTIFTMVKNISWTEAIKANNLNDKQTKNILGFLLNSRYKLNSSVTQAQFLIETGELSANFTAPEKLTDGYGAVQFIYVLSGVIILIFGIVLAAGMIAGEHADGTMKLLLIRPHTRTQVLLSKFLTVALILLGFYALNFALSLGVGAVFWGLKAPLNALSIFNSTHAIILHPFAVLSWLHIFGFFEAVIFALIALTISTVARSRSGAIAISMLIYFVSFILGALLSTYSWYKYVIFNNTNLFQYMSSTGPAIADLTLWFSLAINIIYIVGLGLACFFTFAKRDAT